MRQEMKVGFAIGGVLLAVLVVYVLVVSGHEKANQVTLDKGEPGVSFPADHAKSTDTTADTGKVEISKPVDSVQTDLFKPNTLTKPTTQESSAVASASTNDPWSSALTTGKVPTLYSQTPTAKTTPDTTGNLTLVQKLDQINGFGAAKQTTKADSQKPTTEPSSADGTRSHTVAAGETFSSISTAVYGSANFYPHILRANPSVDPKKLKVGTVLTIPPLEGAKSDKTATVADTSNTKLVSEDFTPKKPIDTKTQYVVLSGDSLYRISVKLYGKADHVDKLAEANKGELGAERRLKIGQVLALPEAPSSAH